MFKVCYTCGNVIGCGKKMCDECQSKCSIEHTFTDSEYAGTCQECWQKLIEEISEVR